MLSLVASKTMCVDFAIVLLVIPHPAIVPPENKTAEPVISPLPFTLNLDADMKYPSAPAEPDI